jgi:hypothetical protein
MVRKSAFLAALGSLALSAGITMGTAQEAANDLDYRCRLIEDLPSVDALQTELERLLREDPNSPCIQVALAQIAARSVLPPAAGPAAGTDTY